MRLSIKNKMIWVMSGNISHAASQFLVLSFIAKLGGPSEVGIFTYALAICSPIFLFLSVKLRSVVLTDFGNENTSEEYFFLRTVTNILSIFTIVLISGLLNFNPYLLVVVVLFGISKIYEMKSDLIYGFYQKMNRFDLYGKSMLVRSLLTLILSILTYYFFKNVTVVMASFLLSNILTYYLFDYQKTKEINIRIRTKNTKSVELRNALTLFVVALPLGLSTVIGSLSTNFPRYLIENNLGLYELGIFSGLAYFLIIGNTFLSAISQIVTPKLALLASKHKYENFKSLLAKIVSLGFLLSISLIIIIYFYGAPLISLIYTPDYAEYHNTLIIISIGMIFLYSSVFLGTAVTSLRLFKIQPIINGAGLVVTIIMSTILIGEYKLNGIAFALLLNYITVSLGYMICIGLVFKKMKRRANY